MGDAGYQVVTHAAAGAVLNMLPFVCVGLLWLTCTAAAWMLSARCGSSTCQGCRPILMGDSVAVTASWSPELFYHISSWCLLGWVIHDMPRWSVQRSVQLPSRYRIMCVGVCSVCSVCNKGHESPRLDPCTWRSGLTAFCLVAPRHAHKPCSADVRLSTPLGAGWPCAWR